jgi:hypothetical protein
VNPVLMRVRDFLEHSHSSHLFKGETFVFPLQRFGSPAVLNPGTAGFRSYRCEPPAAVLLARRLASEDIPVIPYGTPQIGELLGPKLGCRSWDAFDAELDLTTLCLTKG